MANPNAELPTPTPGAKMMFLIRRRDGVSREELIAHWFANHMPGVIGNQADARAAGRPHAWRYLATVFDSAPKQQWDGVAQLWFDRPLPRPKAPLGEPPRDTFQQKAEPYLPWATVEYVIVDGAGRLPDGPSSLNAPYPVTRSGFTKVTLLLAARDGVDFEACYRYWLTDHAPRVAAELPAAGGFRYVVSLSLEPGREPYCGMAELYFEGDDGWSRLLARLEPDDLAQWLDEERSLVRLAGTEMVGIP